MVRKVDIPLPQPFPDKPTAHPVLVQNQETTTTDVNIDWPKTLLLQVEISHLFQAARHPDTPFLNPQQLLNLNFSHLASHVAELAEMQRNLYLHNLYIHGVNALAHVGLPFAYHAALVAQGVEQLSQLRRLIEAETLHRVPDIGKKGALCITQAFHSWATQPILTLNPSDRF
jgi:hypothetical protein